MTLCYHRRDDPNGSPKLIIHVKHTQYDLSKALLQRLEKSKHLSNCQTRIIKHGRDTLCLYQKHFTNTMVTIVTYLRTIVWHLKYQSELFTAYVEESNGAPVTGRRDD